MRCLFACALLVVVTACGTAAASERQPYTFQTRHSFPAGPTAGLHIDNPVGSIRIAAGDVDSIIVTQRIVVPAAESSWAETMLDHVPVTYERRDDGLHVSARILPPLRERSVGYFRLRDYNRGEAHFDVIVPKHCNISALTRWHSIEVTGTRGISRVTTSTGRVHLLRLSGELQIDAGTAPLTMIGLDTRASIRASSGSVHLNEARGHFEIETLTGAVHIDDLQGALRIDARTAPVEVAGLQGDLHVRTSSGNVSARQYDGSVEVHTASGHIELALSGTPEAVRVRTASGDTRLAWPREEQAQFEIQTASGRVDDAIGIDWQTRSGRRSSGRIGQGGPTVDILSQSGNVELEWSI